VPDDVKLQIAEIQNKLKLLPIICKMVEPENLHICLSFLGEVDDKSIEKISEELETICKSCSKFRVKIGEIKFIPSEKYVRVIVLEASDESGSLKLISSDIRKSIGGDAKPPHITICRVKDISDKAETAQKIKNLDMYVDGFDVGGIDIIKSELSRNGPTYTSIKSCKLL
jgi:2'-5' RNA ligase